MAGFENHIGKIDISENYLTELVTHAVTDCFGIAGVCSINVFRSAVSAVKGIVLTLIGVAEARQSVLLTDCAELLISACNEFMCIRLMTDIPHNAVMWRIKDIM